MRRKLGLDAVGIAVAAAAVLMLCLRAVRHFDDSWDATSYHLVFAAFRAGILTPEDFTPIPLMLDQMYKGFPPLLDIIRGYVWRITGSILLLQLFNLSAIVALAGFWRLCFQLPMQWTLIAILSIPLLQIGATTLYVDAWSNCFFAMPLSALSASFIERRRLTRLELAISGIGLAIAANSKPQFMVLGPVLLLLMLAYQAYRLMQEERRRELLVLAGLSVLASAAICFTVWRNLLLEGNPIYPMTVSILGHQLRGTLPTTIWVGPEYLDGVPQPLKWLLSVLEFRAFEGRDLPYTIDQHATIPIGPVPTHDPRPPSFRMGGYFAPLVIGLWVWLLIFIRGRTLRDRLRWLTPPILTAALVAPLPGSFELRYFSFLMLNLAFVTFLAAQRSSAPQMPFGAFLLVMFLAVGMLTGWRYFDATPYSVDDHIKAHGFDRAITGHDLCFEHRNRDSLLFTYIFHSSGRYRVVDLAPGEHCPPR